MLGSDNRDNGGHDLSCSSLPAPLPRISKLQASAIDYTGLVLHARDVEEHNPIPEKRPSHLWSSCFRGSSNKPKPNSNHRDINCSDLRDGSFCIAALLGRAVEALRTQQLDALLKAWLAVDQAAAYALVAAERCAADGKAFQLHLETNPVGHETAASVRQSPSMCALSLPQRLLLADVGLPYGFLLIQSCQLEVGPSSDGNRRSPRPAVLVRPTPRPLSLSAHPAAPQLSQPATPPTDPAVTRRTLRNPDPSSQPQGASSSAAASSRQYASVGPSATEPASCLPGASSNAVFQQAAAAVPLSLSGPSSRLHGLGPGEVWAAAVEYGPHLVTVLQYPGNVLYQNFNSRDYWGDLSVLPLAGPRLLELLLAAERTPGTPHQDVANTSPTEEQMEEMVARVMRGEVVSALVQLPASMAGAVAQSANPWAPSHIPHMMTSAHKPGAAPVTETDSTAVQLHDGSSIAVPSIGDCHGLQPKLTTAVISSIAPTAAAAADRGGKGPVCDSVDRQLLAALLCDEPSVRGGIRNQQSSIPAEMSELGHQKTNNVALPRNLLSMPLRTLKCPAALINGAGVRFEGRAPADGFTTAGINCSGEHADRAQVVIGAADACVCGVVADKRGGRIMGVGATIDEVASLKISNKASVEREQATLIPDTSLGIIVGGAEGDEDSMEAAADVTFPCLALPSARQPSVYCDRTVGRNQASAAACGAAASAHKATVGTVSCLLPYFSFPVEPAPTLLSSPPPASTADASTPLPLSVLACLQPSSSVSQQQPRRKRVTTNTLPQTLQRLIDAATAAASSHKRHQPLRRLTSDLSATSAPNPALLKLTAGLQTVQTLPMRRRIILADAFTRPSSQPVLPPPAVATLANPDTVAVAKGAVLKAGDEYRKAPVVLEEVMPWMEPKAATTEPQLGYVMLTTEKDPVAPPSRIIDANACGERPAFLDSIRSVQLPPCMSISHGSPRPCLLPGDDPDTPFCAPCGPSSPPCAPLPPPRSFDSSCLYEAKGNAPWYGSSARCGGGATRGMACRHATTTGRLPMRFNRHSTFGGPMNKVPVIGSAGVSEQHGIGPGDAAHHMRHHVQTSGSGRCRRPLLHTDTQGRVQMLLSNFTQRLEQQQQRRQHELQRQRLHQQQQQQHHHKHNTYRGPVSCDGGLSVRVTAQSDARGLTEEATTTTTTSSPHRQQRAATVTMIECESPRFALEGKQRLLGGVAWRLDEGGQLVAEPTALEEQRGEGVCTSGGGGSVCGSSSSSSNSGLALGKAEGDTSSGSQQLPEPVPEALPSQGQTPLASAVTDTPSLWHQVHIRLRPQNSGHVSEPRAPGDSGSANASGDGGLPDPARATPPPLVLVVTQVDVTPLVEAQLRTSNLLQQEHRVLESIFPRHCIEYLTLRGHMTSETCGAAAGRHGGGSPSTAATGAATTRERNLNGSAPDVNGVTSIPAKLASLATWHPGVTILFCDIVGFTTACHSASAFAVMAFLNELYSRFDALVDIYKVYKVETIGDCYMVAGGLVAYDEDGYKSVISGGEDPLHAVRVMEFAKAMLRTASGVRMPHTGKPVQLRVGLHSGPVTSGVVGDRMPRFCLFGDTVNTASRMESTCRPGAIHVSAATQVLLPREPWVDLGCSEVKGKGQMRTYEWAGQADEAFEEGQVQRVLGLYL